MTNTNKSLHWIHKIHEKLAFPSQPRAADSAKRRRAAITDFAKHVGFDLVDESSNLGVGR